MKKITYTNKIDDQIIAHEDCMLDVYREAIKKHTPFFEKMGCSLSVGLMWSYFPKDNVLLQRGSFKNGYQCYVYCVVQKDGKDVCVNSIDGEADYYSLSTAWMISSVSRNFFKLKVLLYDDVDEVDVDLSDLFSQLQSATNN